MSRRYALSPERRDHLALMKDELKIMQAEARRLAVAGDARTLGVRLDALEMSVGLLMACFDDLITGTKPG